MASFERSIAKSVIASNGGPPETLGGQLQEGARALSAAGIDDPHSEASALWAAMLGIGVGDVWLRRDEVAGPDEVGAFRDAVARRKNGAPRQYAARRAAFRYLDLYVDERVLIPRPETEGLVQHVLDWAEHRRRLGRVVDVGTGSGAIALSLGLEADFRSVLGVDNSQRAVRVAALNRRRIAAHRPISIVRADALSPVGPGSVDVVVSNPPYVTEDEWRALEAGVRDFEPRGALVSDDSGMGHIRALCRTAHQCLAAGGLLAVEIDARRGALAADAAREAGFPEPRVEPDVFGRDRYLLCENR